MNPRTMILYLTTPGYSHAHNFLMKNNINLLLYNDITQPLIQFFPKERRILLFYPSCR